MRHREILEACWKGYHKEGMKTMFGKRYPNCVKNKKTNEDQGVAEGALNEFDPGESGFGPFKLYKGDRFNVTHIDTFSSLDDAEEELRFQIDLAAQEGSVDYYKIIDGTGEEVGGFNPDEAYDNMRRGSRIQYRKPDDQGVEEGARIARKPGQPAGSKKHSDLYTDENPKGTITGLKFATAEDARASVSKIRNSGRSHAHKIQAAVAMEQRARAAGKSEAAAVYRKYINANKKTNEEQQDVAEGHGRYYCSTDKKWKERKGPKQTRQSESVEQYEYDLSVLTEAELEEDLKKWFKQKWVRFGPDGKIRGECGGRSSGEGKPKCLPASKAHSIGKKGRASSAAKKRREDPNPERRGPAKNVATKTRSMKEQIPELKPDNQPEPTPLKKGLNVLGNIFTAGKLLSDPKVLAHQEVLNVIDPNRQNQSIIRRMQKDEPQQ